MGYFTPTLSAKQQNTIISNAKFAAAKFAQSYADRKGMKNIFTKEDIEDIAGNAVYKACHSMASYTPSKGALSTWVSAIAAKCVITAFKYKMNRIPISYAMTVEDEDGDTFGIEDVCYSMSSSNSDTRDLFSDWEADRDLFRREFDTCVHDEVSKLSAKNQHFEQMLEDGYTPKDMAAAEGCTADAAAKRVWVIRQTLKEPVAEIADEFGIPHKKIAC